MAKPVVKLFDAYYDVSLDIDGLFILSGNRNKVVCLDTSSLQKVILEGRNFEYDGGRLSDGTIQKMTIADADGTVLQTVTGAKLDPGQIAGIDMTEFVQNLSTRLLAGGLKFLGTNLADNLSGSISRDIVNGRGGDDELRGDAGKDVLIGGAGNDEFNFSPGMGRDTITDFDADGGAGLQDFIDANFADVDSITQVGKNTVVDFGDGDVFVLLKVDADLVTGVDFV
ncbi:calcium-binding protein [Rhizobium sp. LjRoot254]|uniref:calcium-binding protein n=1 Tax=Rhizobium sp. LjRoot254 TaxID=3342297 RepID=UPI003ECCE232